MNSDLGIKFNTGDSSFLTFSGETTSEKNEITSSNQPIDLLPTYEPIDTQIFYDVLERSRLAGVKATTLYSRHEELIDKINPDLKKACEVFDAFIKDRAAIVTKVLNEINEKEAANLPNDLLNIVADYVKDILQTSYRPIHSIVPSTLFDLSCLFEKPKDYFKSIDFKPFDEEKLRKAKVITKDNFKDNLKAFIASGVKQNLPTPEYVQALTIFTMMDETMYYVFPKVIAGKIHCLIGLYSKPKHPAKELSLVLPEMSDGRLNGRKSRSKGMDQAVYWLWFNAIRLTFEDFTSWIKPHRVTVVSKNQASPEKPES